MTDSSTVGNLLGVDQAPVPAEPEPESASLSGGSQETVEAPPPEQPTRREIEEMEYLRLKEESDLYGIIKNDPEVNSQVLSIIQNRMKGRTSLPQQAQMQPQTGSDLEALRAENAKLAAATQEALARIAIKEFASVTPDFDAHKVKMGEYLRAGRVQSIEDAYALAKSHTAQQQAARPAPRPPLQASEIKNGGVPRTTNETMKSAQDRINDRKATPRADDYIDAAIHAAIKAQRQGNSE